MVIACKAVHRLRWDFVQMFMYRNYLHERIYYYKVITTKRNRLNYEVKSNYWFT